jgi:5-formyltetrahydrofolate cyclo-ligase
LREAQAIAEKVLSLPAFQECKTISCYLSMPAAEVQTTSLILNILGDLSASNIQPVALHLIDHIAHKLSGKALFVPSITSDGCMDFVQVYTEEDYRSFPSGLWGIPDPTPEWLGKKRQSGAFKIAWQSTSKLSFPSLWSRLH